MMENPPKYRIKPSKWKQGKLPGCAIRQTNLLFPLNLAQMYLFIRLNNFVCNFVTHQGNIFMVNLNVMLPQLEKKQ